jgi:hypothetical protein
VITVRHWSGGRGKPPVAAHRFAGRGSARGRLPLRALSVARKRCYQVFGRDYQAGAAGNGYLKHRGLVVSPGPLLWKEVHSAPPGAILAGLF